MPFYYHLSRFCDTKWWRTRDGVPRLHEDKLLCTNQNYREVPPHTEWPLFKTNKQKKPLQTINAGEGVEEKGLSLHHW